MNVLKVKALPVRPNNSTVYITQGADDTSVDFYVPDYSVQGFYRKLQSGSTSSSVSPGGAGATTSSAYDGGSPSLSADGIFKIDFGSVT